MRLFNLILSLIIIVASVILCQQIISNSISNQQNKNDYAELNHVKYGLFSVDEWKRQITVILAEEIFGQNDGDLSLPFINTKKTVFDMIEFGIIVLVLL